MKLWVTRGGPKGEQEEDIINKSIISIFYPKLPSLVNVKSKTDLVRIFKTTYPEESSWNIRVGKQTSQIWKFINEIKIDDYVLVPLKTQKTIALGLVKSDYKYGKLSQSVNHFRKVKWLKIIPRNNFSDYVLKRLGAFYGVYELRVSEKEIENIQLLLNSKNIK